MNKYKNSFEMSYKTILNSQQKTSEEVKVPSTDTLNFKLTLLRDQINNLKESVDILQQKYELSLMDGNVLDKVRFMLKQLDISIKILNLRSTTKQDDGLIDELDFTRDITMYDNLLINFLNNITTDDHPYVIGKLCSNEEGRYFEFVNITKLSQNHQDILDAILNPKIKT